MLHRDRSNINILVPGAGLGRLSYELASRGYACQGNEFSLFMLFASNFVLNKSVNLIIILLVIIIAILCVYCMLLKVIK